MAFVYNSGNIDPHKNKQKYENWIQSKKPLKYVSGRNREIILMYLDDMQTGFNINSQKKGGRSYSRLNALRVRLPQIADFINTRCKKDIIDITAREIVKLFSDMEKGILRKQNGDIYKSYRDYIKDFKAFWHWYQRYIKRTHNKHIEDVTVDLSNDKVKKREFVYFTIDELKLMGDNAKYKYKVMIYFMFDSGIRAPQELANIKVSDLTEIPNSDRLRLNIRDEISKTFGRKIKLMLCHNMLKDYIKKIGLTQNDYLFKFSPRVTNQYLKRLTEKVLGKKNLTMYDFRHSSACYWLPRYKNETALRYRFGWKNPEMVEYYSQFLGMKDTITEEDLEDVDIRTELQKELEREIKQRELLQDQVESLDRQLNEKVEKDDFVMSVIKGLIQKGKIDNVVDFIHDKKLEKDLLKFAD